MYQAVPVRLACGSPNSTAWEWECKKKIGRKSLFLSLPQYPGLSKLDRGNDSAFNRQMKKKQIWIWEKHKGVKNIQWRVLLISLQSSSQHPPMNLILTWNTPSTLIRGTSPKRQSTGTWPASAGSCVKNSRNKSLLWEGDQQSHSRRKEVIWHREVCCQNVSHSFKMPVCVSLLWHNPFSSPGNPLSICHPAHLKKSRILSIWWYQTVTQTRYPPENKKEGGHMQFAIST